jgi:hypothetical protein
MGVDCVVTIFALADIEAFSSNCDKHAIHVNDLEPTSHSL